jgi:hypothetical protein
MLVIQHRVADYQAWKKAFDSDPIGRARNGVTRHAIFRAADDPGHVVVNLEFTSRERAQDLLAALRVLWRRVEADLGLGGSEGVQVRILDEVEHFDY